MDSYGNNRREDGLRRYRWVIWTIVAVAIMWQLIPIIERQWIKKSAQPRDVTARGELADDEKATIEIFENASPSVVFITTKQRVRDFWSRNVFSVPRGTGSGFIWDDNGHVVTNFHVIKDASEATVRLNDGRSLDAVLVGVSPAHDLAVMRINVAFDRPPPVPIGTSADLKVGQKVFAIGNPFGLDYTLTGGLVSALDRSLEEETGVTIEHLIQTDAAINPGNSGGPLLDSAGRLIGINTAIYSPSGAYAGIGFAVPVDTVNRVVPELIARGKFTRPGLGVQVDERLNQIMSARLNIKGVFIFKVQPGTEAERAGLRGAQMDPRGGVIPGDVITAIDGKSLDSVSALLTRLNDYSVGDSVKLGIWREGNEMEVEVLLGGGV
ncbi:MAG: trypsin-like peptidase domain-containing protein [Deltaproteobacteria bacterium]|nr:trypsin-like peptidase domain-containing protein [Deltaproteobacteria bacterium]